MDWNTVVYSTFKIQNLSTSHRFLTLDDINKLKRENVEWKKDKELILSKKKAK